MKNKENKLFSQWKSKVSETSSAIFVTDGIVSEADWSSAPTKVLYLLKEVNGADEEWDERDYLANYNLNPTYIHSHSPSIDTLAKWQFGISDRGASSWADIEKQLQDKAMQSALLKQICLVNIKKTAGGSVVDWAQFDAYFAAEENRTFLKCQLDLYNPHIVICGGTAWHLCQIKGWNYNSWQQTFRGVRYYKDAGVTYIDFCHPNNRGPKNMIYYALIDTLKELNLI